jgi:hypothetical protein
LFWGSKRGLYVGSPRELLMAAMFLFDKSKRNEDILQRISQTLLLQSLVAIVLCFLRRRLIEI